MKGIYQHDDYRAVLRSELIERIGRNPSYSQRAFARDIGIAPHRLSEIFNRKQGLSRKAAQPLPLSWV